MSRRRDPYWVHSDPEGPRADRPCIVVHRTEPDRLRSAADGRYLCVGCIEGLRETVDGFPARLAALRAHVAAGNAGRSEPVTGSGGDALPVNVHVVDLEVEIAETLASWVRVVGEDRGLRIPPLRPVRPSYGFRTRDVDGLARWLVQHVDWLAAQPFADLVVAELSAVSSRAWAAVQPPAERQYKRFALPGRKKCPTCSARLFVEMDNERSVVRCDGAERHEWDSMQFRALARAVRRAEKEAS